MAPSGPDEVVVVHVVAVAELDPARDTRSIAAGSPRGRSRFLRGEPPSEVGDVARFRPAVATWWSSGWKVLCGGHSHRVTHMPARVGWRWRTGRRSRAADDRVRHVGAGLTFLAIVLIAGIQRRSPLPTYRLSRPARSWSARGLAGWLGDDAILAHRQALASPRSGRGALEVRSPCRSSHAIRPITTAKV